MKKKFRNITVDGIAYTWKVYHDKWADFEVCAIRVWKDKKTIIRQNIPNAVSAITPKVIAEVIKNYEAQNSITN